MSAISVTHCFTFPSCLQWWNISTRITLIQHVITAIHPKWECRCSLGTQTEQTRTRSYNMSTIVQYSSVCAESFLEMWHLSLAWWQHHFVWVLQKKKKSMSVECIWLRFSFIQFHHGWSRQMAIHPELFLLLKCLYCHCYRLHAQQGIIGSLNV